MGKIPFPDYTITRLWLLLAVEYDLQSVIPRDFMQVGWVEVTKPNNPDIYVGWVEVTKPNNPDI